MTSKDGISSDDRFSRVKKDPRFREMPEKERKIKIDKRFQAMFHDKKFSLKYTVDKRGRPMNHNTTEDLKRYYELSDSDEDAETVLDTKKGKQKAKLKKKGELESKETLPKKQKGKKLSNETNDINDNKKVKGSTPSTEMKKEKGPITKQKPPTSIKSSKKLIEVMEHEDSEESDLEVEDKEDSNAEIDSEGDGSDESGMSMEEESDEGSEGSEESEDGASSGEEEDSDSGPDLARGKGNIETSSEEEDEDDEVNIGGLSKQDVEIEHAWREMDKDAPRGDQITRRLAICNMDWDRLKAKDLLALLNSFKPKGSIVFSVKIYPSEFGKQRLKEEELHGPIELRNVSEEDATEYRIYKEKLRDYQFKRLKYYYAVVECDTPETANVIYESCDGLEFESSCSFVDLRFIPDDVQFDDEPKDSAVDVDLSVYKPKYFTSSAMVTSKIELTWDETDQDRVATLNRPFNRDEVLDMDFQAYLASSSEEEEEEEEDVPDNKSSAANGDAKSKKAPKDDEEQIAQYRELLKGIQEKEKRQEDKNLEMEVKWVPGLKENAEQMVKSKLEGRDKMTPWEKYLQKQKDKKKTKKRKKQENVEEANEDDEVPSDVDFNDPFFSEELKKPGLKPKSARGKKVEEQVSSADEEEQEKRKAELSLLMMDDEDDDGRKHFNYDDIVERQNLSRRKLKKLKNKDEILEDDFQINVEDSRFQALYTSHLYNVDPSDPNYKKTKAMQRVVDEKARRREQEQKNYTETVKRQKATAGASSSTGTSTGKTVDPALSSLLKSVKNKTQQFQAAKKQKTK